MTERMPDTITGQGTALPEEAETSQDTPRDSTPDFGKASIGSQSPYPTGTAMPEEQAPTQSSTAASAAEKPYSGPGYGARKPRRDRIVALVIR